MQSHRTDRAVPTPEAVLALGQQTLASQPFSQLLGAQLTALTAEGACELRLPLRQALQQQHGFAHGGVLSYMADNALTYAGAVVLQVPVVTGEFKINYVRPAMGELLIARASCLHAGRTQAVTRCDVFVVQGGVEKLCATAQGTIHVLPDKAV